MHGRSKRETAKFKGVRSEPVKRVRLWSDGIRCSLSRYAIRELVKYIIPLDVSASERSLLETLFNSPVFRPAPHKQTPRGKGKKRSVRSVSPCIELPARRSGVATFFTRRCTCSLQQVRRSLLGLPSTATRRLGAFSRVNNRPIERKGDATGPIQ